MLGGLFEGGCGGGGGDDCGQLTEEELANWHFCGKMPAHIVSSNYLVFRLRLRRAGTNYHWKAEQLPPSAPWSEATLMAFKAFMYFSGKGKPKARCMLYHIFPAV